LGVAPESETIKIIRGAEDAINAAVLFFTSASTVSVYADDVAPSLTIGVKRIKKCYEELKRRNAKVKWITEITKDNLSYCREITQYAELRHLDGIKGNFAVSDEGYIATATINKDQPVPELIYSSAKGIIEQNRYVFDTLWSRAVVAQDRIKEIEEGTIRRETKTLKNLGEILQETAALAGRSKRYSVCSGSNGLLYAYTHFLDVFKDILDRHLNNTHSGIRWITKIDDNDQDSRLFEAIRTFTKLGMKIRHVKNIPPMSFGISDKEMNITIEDMHKESAISSAIFTNEPAFVEEFANIFAELWNIGIDAKDRIEQIESKSNMFIDIIENPLEIQRRYRALVESAKPLHTRERKKLAFFIR